MARFLLACRFFAALSFLSVGKSMDSINLDLEILDQIPLEALGTPDLERHRAEWDVTVDDTCNYLLRVSFFKHADDKPGDAQGNFGDVCEPNTETGNAPDGLPWHQHRRHWAPFPPYVFDTTGFNHMSIYWRPCGLPPKGLRQSRYEINLYNVIPQYRVFMRCQEFKTPSVCQYNQSSWLGRGHFSLPRLERDPNFLANMPLGYQPDGQEPEAYQYEGMISYNEDRIPETPGDWILPTFLMSTYDGDTVSWRGLLPHTFVSGGNSTEFSGTQFYVFQTQPRLPAGWNMTYDAPSGNITLLIHGSAGMCGEGFDAAKNAFLTEEDDGTRLLRGSSGNSEFAS
jgi:hypothetical protein